MFARSLNIASLFLLAALSVSCGSREDQLTVYFPQSSGGQQLEKYLELAELIQQQSGIEFVPYLNESDTRSPLELISERVIDLTVVENSAPYANSINTVLPIYRGVLHVMHREELEILDPGAILSNHSVYIDSNSAVAHDFVDLMIERLQVPAESLNLVDAFEPGVTDVIIVFAPILPAAGHAALKGYRLMSFDDVSRLGHGSKVEAIPYLFPQMQSCPT